MSAIGLLARGAAAMQGRRRAGTGDVVPPTVGISGTVLIGETLTAAHDGDSVQWFRDGVAISGATSDTYVVTASDIGPEITCEATNGAGTSGSNTLLFDDAAMFPASAIGVSTAGLTLADSDTTVQSWAASLGAIACTLAAPGSANRPAYSAAGGTGGRPLVTTDGVDDVLIGSITKGSAWDNYETGIVGSRVAFGVSGDSWLSYFNSVSVRFGLQDNSLAAGRWSVVGGLNLAYTTDPDGVVAHYSGDAAAGTMNARVGGAVEATSAATVTSRADGGDVYLGGRVSGANAANIAVQAWYVGPALTSTQRDHLRALLTYHTGVAC